MRNQEASPPVSPPAVPVIDENAVYFVDTLQAIFRLRKSTIRREWRAGRLRISKRCGRYYVLGVWVLSWLRNGEVLPGKARSVEVEAGVDEE